MPIDFDKYNDAVQEWTKDTIRSMQNQAGEMGVTHRSVDVFNGDTVLKASESKSPSIKKLRDNYGYNDGAISRVSIKFPRILIYTHQGAGKGVGGSVGSKWTDKYGKAKRTNPRSKGKLGTNGRTAKPFFNSVLESPNGVEKLADIVAGHIGDDIVNNMLIK